MIKEVIFFCYGDSTNASTWSNVPFLFTKTLEKKGILVRRVNINIYHRIGKLYNYLVKQALNVFFPNHQYSFIRTIIFKHLVNKKIKRSLELYTNAELCIFTCFDFYNKFNKKPTLLFSDWTYEILIKERLDRKPYFFEKRFISQQKEAINNSQYIVSLFPICTQKMKNCYPKANIQYLGNNVINSLYNGIIDVEKTIFEKCNSKKILFIGSSKYKEGAKILIDAIKLLPNIYELHIIGMEKHMFRTTSDNIYFYGYLHKDIEEENKIYYDLLLSSKVVVNPTPTWAGYSSIIEAMYFYNPIVVSPFDDFVREFGEKLDFGLYNYHNTIECLMSNLINILDSNPEYYKGLCMNAHNAVKEYTWDNYVNRILNLLTQ